MSVRWWFVLGIFVLMPPNPARAQEEVKISGRVVDAAGKSAAGVKIGTSWYVDRQGDMNTYKGAGTSSDKEGRFSLTTTFYGRGRGLLALDFDRKSGALLVLEEKDAAKPVELKLVPLVHVHGSFFCKELAKKPTWTMVYMMNGPARFLGCSSDEASFSFHLPPGEYQFWGYGTDIQDLKRKITLSADKPDYDMGTLDVPATIIARHKGKAPPAWHVTDARGVKKEVKISDFKGKWVLLEFWGYW
jgi:hypothetical protein